MALANYSDLLLRDGESSSPGEPSVAKKWSFSTHYDTPEAFALDYYRHQGWEPHQAAAIVGNLSHESAGMNPEAMETGGKGYGLAQWTASDRIRGLMAHARAKGETRPGFLTQLEYVQKELDENPDFGAESLRAAKDVDEATKVFSAKYERPGIPRMESRLQRARKIAGDLISPSEAGAAEIPVAGDPSISASKIQPVLDANKEKNFVQRIMNPEKYPTIDLGDGSVGTHLMSSAEFGNKNVVFPLIVQDPQTGQLTKFDDFRQAADYAKKTGEYIPFNTREEAEWFGKNYKDIWGKDWRVEGGKVIRGTPARAAEIPKAEGGEKPSANYADMLLRDAGGGVQDKPQLKPRLTIQAGDSIKPTEPKGREGAPDSGTVVKAGIAQDKLTKLKIYAAARFPEEGESAVRRYWMDRDGNIEYIDDDHIIRRESPGSLKETLADATGSIPRFVGGVAGGAIGARLPIPGAAPTLAMVGSGLGAIAEQFVGETLGDKPKTPMQRAGAFAEGAAEAGVGELVGYGGVKLINRLKRPSGVIAERLQVDYPIINQVEAQRAIDLGREFGIQLNQAEIYNSPTLLNILHQASKTPGPAAEKLRIFNDQVRIPQVNAAIERELNSISPEASVFEAGKKASQASTDALESLKGQRLGSADPYYKRAKTSTQSVDMVPVLSEIERRFGEALPNGTRRPGIERLRQLFVESQGVKLPDGTVKVIEKPITDVKRLIEARKEIDNLFKGEQDRAIRNSIESDKTEIKKILTQQMEGASPEFATGRRIWKEKSETIDDFLYGITGKNPNKKYKKTILGTIEALEGENVAKAPQILFGADSSPEAVALAKKYIQGSDPDAWDAIVRATLQQRLEAVPFGSPSTYGIRFRNKVLPNVRQEAMLKTAMEPDQFKHFEDLLEVLQIANRSVYTNSQTAFMLAGKEAVELEAGGGLAKAMRLPSVITPGGWMRRADLISQIRTPGYLDKITTALYDPAMMNEVTKIKKLGPGAARSVRAVTLMAAIAGGDQIDEDLSGSKEFYPYGKPNVVGEKK